MMLAIQILNGSCQGEVLELFSTSPSPPTPITLREDDVIRFTTVLDEDLLNLTLVLHENEVLYTRRFEKDGRWIYEWLPKDMGNRKEAFFHNYYGLAELTLIAKNPQNSDEFIFFRELNPIEVLAKKINAERISYMLDFLARQDGKDLASAIRITRIRAGYKDGGRTATFLLERIEHNLIFLKKALPAIGSRPIMKLEQISRLVIPNQETLIDERSLSWITENTDNLYQASSLDESILSFEGENFSAYKIIESQTDASFDVYENQVLHGFIATLIFASKDIQAKLSRYANMQLQPTRHFEGYVSFFSQLNKFSDAINKSKFERCSQLIIELSRIHAWLKQKLPVKKTCLGIPHFTQKAKYNLCYQQVFNRMISWHRHGAPDWSFQDELNSIKDIPRLFEYYLLCVTKHHLENMGTPDVPVTQEYTKESSDIFEYKWGETKIRLMYEPQIWMAGHTQINSMNLVNTEGWTTINRENNYWPNAKLLKPRGSTGRNSNRCPDLMIEISQENNNSSHIIIDAKYTDSKKAFITELPSLTMKYIHGIHQRNSHKNQTRALMIVNPDEKAHTKHFHHDDYSIYGRYPVTPALMVTSIDVSKAHESNSNIRGDISRLIELAKLGSDHS